MRMTRQYELVERVKSYEPNANEALLNRAYVYAMKAHGNQKRASGAPFFSHPLEVAAILADMRLDDATIATALLHDTIEDTGATRPEIDALFGPEIGSLVEGLTKIKKLDLVTKKAEQAENFRKLLLAISSDIRVLLVKLADRLHNMRTLGAMKPAKRRIIAEETMEIYAPLAGRMGMQWLRDELEDHAFRWLKPEGYAAVVERLRVLRERNQGLIEEIEGALTKRLQEAKVEAVVSGREKKPYAIWNKMERKQISLEQLSDIYAFRIIVEELIDCYRALAVVHTTWHAVPGRFKDYISSPKQNDYQSIHTTIIGPRHQRAELQLRTERMHQVAEYGVAAHALYKDAANGSGAVPQEESNAYRWLRHLVETLLEGDNPEEFLEHTKLELFQDQVFCFTPKGRLIALPRGAKPIDFAYAVHTDIGNTCVGCKINGRAMPLVTELRNGDEVEIICASVKAPPAAWQSLAVTGKARSAIRRATRDASRAQYGKLGREILRRAFTRRGRIFEDEAIAQAVGRLSQKTVEDVVAAVGRGELASADVVRAIWPEDKAPEPSKKRRKVKRTDEGWFGLGKVIGLKFRWPGSSTRSPRPAAPEQQAGIPIRGLQGDLPVSFAEHGAVPGDRIVGILTAGQGITIYPIHSEALKAFDEEPERWIDVTWDIDEDNAQRFPARISVVVLNEPGSLAQITAVIGEADGNIDNIKMTNRVADYTETLIDLEVWDLKHLNEIMTGLRGLDVVSGVERI
jgi:RelA/SpoT family (p)ppGpp synthetase